MVPSWGAKIIKKSEEGPFIQDKEFDLLVIKKVAELKRKYNIEFEEEEVVPADNGLADRLFEAGVELIKETGVYNLSARRRILFSEEELIDAIESAPDFLILGAGKDSVEVYHRTVEDKRPCVIHSGPTGTPCSEKYYPLILQSCLQEPLVDFLGAGSLDNFEGTPIIAGSPLEILASNRAANVARQMAREAGRPGIHINDVAIPLTCSGKIASFDPVMGLRPTDGLLVSQMPELRTDYDQLSRVAFIHSQGMHVVNLMTPLVGGLGGGAEGTAIVNIASHILGVICYGASYHDMGHMSLHWSHNTDRLGLWIYAVAGQAIARNTPFITKNAIYTRSGLGTEEILWEIAAGAIASTPCGIHQMGVGVRGGSVVDQTSGLEARFNAEVAHAALNLTREEANRLVKKCLEKYEVTLKNPPPGKSFPELYDLNTLSPREFWLDAYAKVREQLVEIGLELT